MDGWISSPGPLQVAAGLGRGRENTDPLDRLTSATPLLYPSSKLRLGEPEFIGHLSALSQGHSFYGIQVESSAQKALLPTPVTRGRQGSGELC